jgi:5'-3' exonuclease
MCRWLSQKYPAVVKNLGPLGEGESLCDNLYLDMNGIIHPCSHPEDKPPPDSEEAMFDAICDYIDHLVEVCPPSSGPRRGSGRCNMNNR